MSVHSPLPGRQMVAQRLLLSFAAAPLFWLSGALPLLHVGLPACSAAFSNSSAALHLRLQIASSFSMRQTAGAFHLTAQLCAVDHMLPGMHHAMLRSQMPSMHHSSA